MKNLKHLQKFKGNPKKYQGGFIGAAALVVSIIGLGVSYEQGQQAASSAEEQSRANERARQASERAANVRAQQERIKTQREARIARAQLVSGATSAGAGVGTSALSGGKGSISSQLGANIGSINVAQDFASQASTANQQAATAGAESTRHQAIASQWQMISNTGFSIFQQNKPQVAKAQATTPARTIGVDEFSTYFK
jgi:hypothetical protein